MTIEIRKSASKSMLLGLEAAFSPRVIVRRRKLAKLVVDRIIAGLVLIAAIPLLLIVALAIKLDSGGPLFFRQVRVGRGGRLFKMWKFRSMVVDAEALHPGATAADESGVLSKLAKTRASRGSAACCAGFPGRVASTAQRARWEHVAGRAASGAAGGSRAVPA